MRKIVCAGVGAAILMAAASQALAQGCPSPAGFPRWLQGFKQEAAAQGISAPTLSALNGLTYDPATIAKDRAQGVFAQTFLQFSDRMVSKNRLQVGSALIKKNAGTFAKIEQEYCVPAPVMVAYWGLETDFGKVMGNLETLRSLATLSFDCRRPEEFKEQLTYALRVVERGDLVPEEMRGPAHGEVGQFQFQPKIYFEYAVDFDGNGRRDMIRSAPDALASAANYLKGMGWQAGQPWIEEVSVPAEMDWSQADVTIKKPRSYWAQAGVTYRNGKALPADDVQTSLLLPMGRHGPAFLAYDNFTKVYLRWNESLIYTTTAAYFATRLAGAPPVGKGNGPANALDYNQIMELQKVLTRMGYDVGKIDGKLGALSRAAVKAVQIKLGLPPDSWPTPELLARLRNG